MVASGGVKGQDTTGLSTKRSGMVLVQGIDGSGYGSTYRLLRCDSHCWVTGSARSIIIFRDPGPSVQLEYNVFELEQFWSSEIDSPHTHYRFGF